MEPERADFGPLVLAQFRQQMNNLAAAAQLLTPVVQEKAGPQYDPYLAILHQSLYRMMRMVGNLEYLQFPEEDVPFRADPLELAGLCRELGAEVASLAELAGVHFTYEGEDAALPVCGDRAQLRRLLLNLIANAIGAAGEEGRAGLRLTRRSGWAALTVWDTGAGLGAEPDEAERLQRPGSLGLGLRVARSIAARHGGSIVFEQKEERGTRAVVSLPLQAPEPGAVLKTPKMGFDGGGGFSDLLVELAGVLPHRAFQPADLE